MTPEQRDAIYMAIDALMDKYFDKPEPHLKEAIDVLSLFSGQMTEEAYLADKQTK